MAEIILLLEVPAIVLVCLLAGLAAFGILFCIGMVAMAAGGTGRRPPSRLGLLELNAWGRLTNGTADRGSLQVADVMMRGSAEQADADEVKRRAKAHLQSVPR